MRAAISRVFTLIMGVGLAFVSQAPAVTVALTTSSCSASYTCQSGPKTCYLKESEVTCGQEVGCRWMPGCVEDCAVHPRGGGCNINCRDAELLTPSSQEACEVVDGCLWQNFCFRDDRIDCEGIEDESECKNSGCQWKQIGPALH